MRPLIRKLNCHISHIGRVYKSPKLVSIQVAIVSQRNMTSTSKPKVYVTRKVHEEGINLLREHCVVTQWDSEATVPRDELLQGVKNADALFCLLTDKIDAEVLDSAGIHFLISQIGVRVRFLNSFCLAKTRA